MQRIHSDDLASGSRCGRRRPREVGYGTMVVFPLISTLVSLACAGTIARDAYLRPRPEKIAWAAAFSIFAIAAGAETWAGVDGWSPFVVRLFYLTGAVLVDAYLGLGELYLLAPRRMQAIRVVPGLTLLLTALAATLVWSAPINDARLSADGWEALERGGALVALVALCSGLGTVVIVGGALWSAWRYRRLGAHRHRLVGCVLIAVGTLVVAAKGTLSRTGLPEETFALAMAVGVATIFAGYLETRRSISPQLAMDAGAPEDAGSDGVVALPDVEASPHEAATPHQVIPMMRRAGRTGPVASDPGIAFIEERFLPLDDAALATLCRNWSAAPPEVDAFGREDARRVWALRTRLSVAGQATFDAHDVPTQLALTELYFEVLAPGGAEPNPLPAALAQRG